MKFQLKQQFRIESARFLPNLTDHHPCKKIHGHSFRIWVLIEGPLKHPEGWVMDYNDINKAVLPILKPLDHRLLNEVPGLENPTSESLCRYLFDQIKPVLTGLTKVVISETEDSECSYPA